MNRPHRIYVLLAILMILGSLLLLHNSTRQETTKKRVIVFPSQKENTPGGHASGDRESIEVPADSLIIIDADSGKNPPARKVGRRLLKPKEKPIEVTPGLTIHLDEYEKEPMGPPKPKKTGGRGPVFVPDMR